MRLESIIGSFKVEERKVFIRIRGHVCEAPEQLLESELFFEIVKRCLYRL